MFVKHSKTNNALLVVASLAFLVNIFISVLDYLRFGNGTSIAIIAVPTLALLLIFWKSKKARNERQYNDTK